MRCGSPRHQRGVVMVIALLGLILLAALLFYVFNLGRNVQGRIDAQNAADAAAVAGATQMARSMNTVAMNNVDMARAIAAINVLDATPMALDFTVTDPTEFNMDELIAQYLAVDHQLRRGVAIDVLRRELEETRSRLGDPTDPNNSLLEPLHTLDDLYRNDPDLVTDMTFYQTPSAGGRGGLWQTLYTLDGVSRATIAAFGRTAQAAAVTGGEVNLTGQGVDHAALLLPVEPMIPWVRGTFDDFETAVDFGLPPKTWDTALASDGPDRSDLYWAVHDRTDYRGPYDTLYGWRSRGRAGDRRGNPPGYSLSSLHYTVYGPQTRMINTSYYSRFDRYRVRLRQISDIKQSYVWPVKRNDTTDQTLVRIIEPDWEVDIENDNERSRISGMANFSNGDQDDQRIKIDDSLNEVPLLEPGLPGTTAFELGENYRRYISQTMYVVLDLYHDTADNPFNPAEEFTGSYNAGSTWYIDDNRGGIGDDTMFPRFRGNWSDPTQGAPGRMNSNIPDRGEWDYEYTQIDYPYLWKETIAYQTDPYVLQGLYANGGYPQLGLDPIRIGTDADGRGIYQAQRYYRTRYFLLVGVNVGPERPVRDPYTGFNPDADDAPAPIDLDHDQLPSNDERARAQYLTVLGIARRDDTALIWPGRFDDQERYGQMVALAQARVFNNHSFDLWTQSWLAQLEPVGRYDDWLATFERDGDAAADSDVINPDGLEELLAHLRSLETLVDETMEH